MTSQLAPCRMIDEWPYYQLDQIDQVDTCTGIANTCWWDALYLKIKAVVFAILGAGFFYVSYLFTGALFKLMIIHGFSLLAFAASMPILGFTSIPAVSMAIFTSRSWQHADHLQQQRVMAEKRITDILSERG